MLSVSKAAALRILAPYATLVESFREMPNGAIQVTYRIGKRRASTFISRRSFDRDFIEFRVAGSKNVLVENWGAGSYRNHYSCKSVNGDRSYTVRCFGLAVSCECEDYQQQWSKLGSEHSACKHSLAVMNERGFGSLREYLDAQSAQANADLFGHTLIEAQEDAVWANY